MNAFRYFCFACLLATRLSAAEPLQIGNDPQVLVDDHVVESMNNLARRIVPLAKHAANPVLTATDLWEGKFAMPISVYYDASEQKFRMWYRPGGDKFALAYATSDDGLKWHKPALKLVAHQGSLENNLLAVRSGPAWNGLFCDERETDPARKFKYLSYNTAKNSNGLYLHTSADGFAWTLHSKTPTVEGLADCHSLLGWDPSVQQYVAFVRPDKVVRTIARTSSPDMIHWSEVQPILAADDDDPPGMQLYGMPAFRDRSGYYGMLWMYHPNTLMIDVQLAFSRDGKSWQRTARRHPILSFGLPNQFDSHQVFAMAPIIRGDELYIFYMGQDAPHPIVYANEVQPPLKTVPPRKDQTWLATRTGGMGLAICQRDRFVALEAGSKPGELITKPFKVTGSQLLYNADASRGEIETEIQDETGTPIPGFSMPYSVDLRGNSVRLKQEWRGNKDFSSLKDRTIKLRVQLRTAKLYSFEIAP